MNGEAWVALSTHDTFPSGTVCSHHVPCILFCIVCLLKKADYAEKYAALTA